MTTTITYPIFRNGCLVSALRADGSVRTFSYTEGENAVRELDNASAQEKFRASIHAAVAAALAECDPNGRMDVPLDFPMTMQPARRSPSLGVVYDLQEFTFTLRGEQVVGRGCVTVCVGPQDAARAPASKSEGGEQLGAPEKDGAGPSSPEAYSKFWARFLIASLKNFSVEEIRQFETDCTVLGKALLHAMEEPYRGVLRATTKTAELPEGEDLTVKCQHNEYRVIAVASGEDDFSALFDAVRDGERLGDQIEKNNSAKQLAQLGLAVIAKSDPNALGDYSTKIRGHAGFSVYDPPDYYRGLLLEKTDGTQSVVVGITQGPQSEGVEQSAQFRIAASNVVSIRLVNDWGIRR